jgi:hypothetical protein
VARFNRDGLKRSRREREAQAAARVADVLTAAADEGFRGLLVQPWTSGGPPGTSSTLVSSF